MVLVLSALVVALSAASFVSAQNQNSTYINGLIQSLNNGGLTTLASAISAVNSTNVGSQVLGRLSNQTQNYTVFAPNNDAFNNVPSNVTQDANRLADIVAYHVVFGHFNNVTDYPDTTIGRTALGNPSVVMLEGNKDQVVAWARRQDGQVHVLNQNATDDPRIVQLTKYQNLDIYVIDGILFYPGDISSTIQSNSELSGFSNFAQNTQVPVWNTGTNSTENTSVITVLDGVRGITLFAPDNQASSQLQQFSGNTTALWDVLRNHVINGTTVYSPSLVNSTKYTTAGGETLQFSSNSSGRFVTTGNTTAQVVQPDVLTENGVIHIINGVLLNENVDENAANSAYSSASSAAEHSSTETGPVGVPTGSTSNHNDNTSGAVGVLKGVNSYGIIVLSVVLGSSFLFA